MTILPTDNSDDDANRVLEITGTASGPVLSQPDPMTLIIVDDEGNPGLGLEIIPSISDRNVAVAKDNFTIVTARLDRATTEDVTVALTVAPADLVSVGLAGGESMILTIPLGKRNSFRTNPSPPPKYTG